MSVSIAEEWIEEDRLMLMSCWSRDGYTYKDIANRIGISEHTLIKWREKYPEINEALKNGREIVDYKVENALLKSALGYRTKEVKVITEIKHGKIISTVKETTTKDQAPNVSACQVWLYNRLPDKWKRNRDNLIELDEEDTTIHVTVTRAGADKTTNPDTNNTSEEDDNWQDEVNTNITISKNTEEEETPKKKKQQQKNTVQQPQMETKSETVDLDAWPDDWEDE